MEINSNGIVIRTSRSGESNYVLTILTSKYGKISSFNKFNPSTKKTKSILVERFDYGNFIFSTKSNKSNSMKQEQAMFKLMNESQVKSNYLLRTNLACFQSMSIICDLADIITEDANTLDGSLYEDVVNAQKTMTNSTTVREALRITFNTSRTIVLKTGILEPNQLEKPTFHNLNRIINIAENYSGRELKNSIFISKMVSTLHKQTSDRNHEVT